MLRGPIFLILYFALVCLAVFGAYRGYIDSLIDWSMPAAVLLLVLSFLADTRGHKTSLKYLSSFGLIIASLLSLALVYPGLENRFTTVILLNALYHGVWCFVFISVPYRPLEIPNIRKYPWMIFLVIALSAYTFMDLRDQAATHAWTLVLTIAGFSFLVLTAFNRAHAVSSLSYRWVLIGSLALLAFDLCYLWLKFDTLDPSLSPWRYALLGIGLWSSVFGLSQQITSSDL